MRVFLAPSGEDSLIITVQDEGVGIPEADLPHLFHRYSKLTKSGTMGEKGTGLGLFITKTLVEKHGGSISLESTPGRGTQVKVTLPLVNSTLENS